MGVDGAGLALALQQCRVQRQQGQDTGRAPPQSGRDLTGARGPVVAEPGEDRCDDPLAQPAKRPLHLLVGREPLTAQDARRGQRPHGGVKGVGALLDLLVRDAGQRYGLDDRAVEAAAQHQGVAAQRGDVDDGDGPVGRRGLQPCPVRRPVEAAEAGQSTDLRDEPVELGGGRPALSGIALRCDQFRADPLVAAGEFRGGGAQIIVPAAQVQALRQQDAAPLFQPDQRLAGPAGGDLHGRRGGGQRGHLAQPHLLGGPAQRSSGQFGEQIGERHTEGGSGLVPVP
ncbi:hypothetical protein SGLAM104S_09439 [Streptomyces glaucescens]